MVDAPIIDAPPSTKNKDKARDPEMHQAKKGKQWYFGMKAQIRALVEHPRNVLKNLFNDKKPDTRA